MASTPDDLRARIEAYPWPAGRGGIEMVRANKGYTLHSLRTGGPVARLRPTGQGDKVQVLWWRREAWSNPGPFSRGSCRSRTLSRSSLPRASSGSMHHDELVTACAN